MGECKTACVIVILASAIDLRTFFKTFLLRSISRKKRQLLNSLSKMILRKKNHFYHNIVCEKFWVFLPLRFYVKSVLENLEVGKLSIFKF